MFPADNNVVAVELRVTSPIAYPIERGIFHPKAIEDIRKLLQGVPNKCTDVINKFGKE